MGQKPYFDFVIKKPPEGRLFIAAPTAVPRAQAEQPLDQEVPTSQRVLLQRSQFPV